MWQVGLGQLVGVFQWWQMAGRRSCYQPGCSGPGWVEERRLREELLKMGMVMEMEMEMGLGLGLEMGLVMVKEREREIVLAEEWLVALVCWVMEMGKLDQGSSREQRSQLQWWMGWQLGVGKQKL